MKTKWEQVSGDNNATIAQLGLTTTSKHHVRDYFIRDIKTHTHLRLRFARGKINDFPLKSKQLRECLSGSKKIHP